MTRDDLEASFRRNLTELHVPGQFHNAIVDNFLPVADDYAVYTGGIIADRRAELLTPAELARPHITEAVHYHHPIACGTSAKRPRWTGDYTRVTCGRCKRSSDYRKEASRG